jgi:hypothetical protein
MKTKISRHKYLLLIMGAIVPMSLFAASATAHPGHVHTQGKKHFQTAVKTVLLPPGKTKTILVNYPRALKYRGASYSGSVQVLLPNHLGKKQQPSAMKVNVLKRGSLVGGTVYRVIVKNYNSPDSATVKVRVKTKTTW